MVRARSHKRQMRKKKNDESSEICVYRSQMKWYGLQQLLGDIVDMCDLKS